MKQARLLILLALAAGLPGCGVLDNKLLGSSVPRNGSLIPNTRLQLTPSYTTSVESVALAAAAGAALYYVYRPLDANWEGADLPVSEDTYRVSLRMKRFFTGGEGEALSSTRRYADQLVAARGARGYTLLEFASGIDSSTPIARRVAEAVIRLHQPNPLPPSEIDGPPWPLVSHATS